MASKHRLQPTLAADFSDGIPAALYVEAYANVTPRSTNPLFEGSEDKLLYVGGGISSIEAAKIALAGGTRS